MRHDTDAVDVLRLRIVLFHVLLRDQKDPLVVLHRGVERRDGLEPSDVEVDHGLWEADQAAQHQQRQRFAVLFVSISHDSVHLCFKKEERKIVRSAAGFYRRPIGIR